MATAQSRLSIIIDVITGNGKKAVSDLDLNLTQFLSTAGMVVGVLGAFAVAAKKAFDLGKEGAQLQLVEERFARLAESIGTTGEALMTDLGPAMGGMLSDAEMMAAATDLMALGLVKTHDEAIRLAAVAGQLGMNMNQLVLTLTNETTMRFDSLGVSVDGFDEKVAALEATGMSASEAFGEAFLQQAEEQLERVGSAADTAAGEFAQFDAEMKNMTDTMKKGVSSALLPMISALNDQTDQVEIIEEAYARHIITWGEYQTAMGEAQSIMGDATDIVAELSATIDEQDAYVDRVNERWQAYYDALSDAAQVTEETDDAIAGTSRALEEEADAILTTVEGMNVYTEKGKEYVKMLREQENAAYDAAAAQEAIDAAILANAAAATTAMDAMQKYMAIFENTDEQEVAADVTDAFTDHLVDQAEAAAALGQDYQPYLDALAEIDPLMATALEESLALTESMTYLDNLLKSGKISPEEYGTAVEAMTTAIANGEDPILAMEAALQLVYSIVNESITVVDNFKVSLDELVAGSPYKLEVITTYTDVGGGGGGTTTTTTTATEPPAPGTSGEFEATGTGGDWKSVPGGYPGDSFPVWMSSGEKYMVATPGEKTGGGPVVYQTNNVVNTNPLVAAMNQAFIDSSLLNEFRSNL